MEIKTLSEGTEAYAFALVGRLDTNTSPQLEEFTEGLYEKGVSNICVDMGECVFVSSAGLRVIVAMQKQASKTQGSLEFKNVTNDVAEVFAMTGFDKILTFS